ncbi:hypothetical protein WKI72_00900 [Candidatus Erwinia dacicola]|uniref:MukF domain protein n=1 Tax=Candidatus Erwinia dacicola TaxID=252393 RepID=A0A328THJ0_9GAMM|nr:mukF domain protein [Candidatus Erwinia dacicola]
MEQLRSELELVLGETVSLVECISQQLYASLYNTPSMMTAAIHCRW